MTGIGRRLTLAVQLNERVKSLHLNSLVIDYKLHNCAKWKRMKWSWIYTYCEINLIDIVYHQSVIITLLIEIVKL